MEYKTYEQVSQALLDRFGFIVLGFYEPQSLGYQMSLQETNQPHDGLVVCIGPSTKEEFIAQSIFCGADPEVSVRSYDKFYYKFTAE